MQYDKPLLAAVMGILSAISYEIFTWILLFLGIGKYSLYQLDSFIITLNRPSIFIGFIVSSMSGILVAILLYYGLKKLGQDYIVYKSLLASILTWVILELAFTAIIEGKLISPRPISDYINHFLGTVVFGITLGLLFEKYLFKKTNPNIL